MVLLQPRGMCVQHPLLFKCLISWLRTNIQTLSIDQSLQPNPNPPVWAPQAQRRKCFWIQNLYDNTGYFFERWRYATAHLFSWELLWVSTRELRPPQHTLRADRCCALASRHRTNEVILLHPCKEKQDHNQFNVDMQSNTTPNEWQTHGSPKRNPLA